MESLVKLFGTRRRAAAVILVVSWFVTVVLYRPETGATQSKVSRGSLSPTSVTILEDTLAVSRTAPMDAMVVILLPRDCEQIHSSVSVDVVQLLWPRKILICYEELPAVVEAILAGAAVPADLPQTFMVLPIDREGVLSGTRLTNRNLHGSVASYRLERDGESFPVTPRRDAPEPTRPTLVDHPFLSLLQLLILGTGLCLLAKVDLGRLGLRGLGLVWTMGSLAVGSIVVFAGLLETLVAARVIVGVTCVTLLVMICACPSLRRRLPNLHRPRAEGVFLAIALAAGVAWLGWGWVNLYPVPLRGDEVHIWGAKASVAIEAGGFGAEYRDLANATPRPMQVPDYPPLNPLLQIWMRIGHHHDIAGWTRWPIQAFDLAAMFYLAGMLSRKTRGWLVAMIGAGTFLTMRYAQPLALSDGLVALGALMAVDGTMTLLARRPDAGLSLPLGLLLMVAAKHEGIALTLALAAGTAFVVRFSHPRPDLTREARLRLTASFVAAGFLVGALWWWNRVCGFSSYLVGGEKPGLLETILTSGPDRTAPLLWFFARDYVLDSQASGLLALLAIGVSILVGRRDCMTPKLLVPALVFFLGAIAFLVVFIGTPLDWEWQWRVAGPRVLGQLNLVLAAWAGVALGRVFPPRAGEVRGRCRGTSSMR
ncbi:MAG: hypothetical protein CMJ83_16215 [Planctomycetes bacterium]|nr:hypothetical protein [Planctomycetota bacterium]